MTIVYRDDFPPCVDDAAGILRTLYDDAEVVITPGDVAMACAEENVDVVTADGKDFLVVGTKAFGENLNWLMRSGDWTNQTNEVPEATLAMDAHDRVMLLEDCVLKEIDAARVASVTRGLVGSLDIGSSNMREGDGR